MLQMMDQKHTCGNRKEHWILEHSYDVFIQLRWKLSTCKFPLALLDGTILAWNNPELFAWTGANIRSKEGKQRGKISSRGRNSTPKQQLSETEKLRDMQRKTRSILKNLMIPQRSTSSALRSFQSPSKKKAVRKQPTFLCSMERSLQREKQSCQHRKALQGSASARGDSKGRDKALS